MIFIKGKWGTKIFKVGHLWLAGRSLPTPVLHIVYSKVDAAIAFNACRYSILYVHSVKLLSNLLHTYISLTELSLVVLI